MSNNHNEPTYPIIWAIFDQNGVKLGQTIQMNREAAELDASNRFSAKWATIEDTGKVKPPNKCCNKCGHTPCS